MAVSELVLVIDTREQLPYQFPCRTVVKTLTTGDYSLLGFEDTIAIERKSKDDAYNTIGQGRKRFERELSRLSRLEFSAIVIESSVADFLTPPARSQLNPRSAINSLIAWEIRYGVHLWFAGSRTLATAATFNMLKKFWKERGRK